VLFALLATAIGEPEAAFEILMKWFSLRRAKREKPKTESGATCGVLNCSLLIGHRVDADS